MDKEYVLNQIKNYLYQLCDVSKYINEIYTILLAEDYSFYHNILTLAIIEEHYIMNELTIYLNYYCDYKKGKGFKSWLKSNPSFKVTVDDLYHHYTFNAPYQLKEYSQEYIMLKSLLEKFKQDTNDLDYFTTQFGVSERDRLFRIQCRYNKFDTSKWLKMNNIEVDFI